MVHVSDHQELYGLPLEQFVSVRGTLAKALRKDGHREEANEVSSLRKPSVAAWAVNQLVRTRSAEIAALFEAGDGLQHAQSELLAGRGGGSALREAVARERDAVGALAEHARGLLSSDGHELTPAALDRVSETLHAAALDEDARAQVKDGCLERELRHVGLGGLDAAAPAPPRARKRRAPEKAPKRDERERAQALKAAHKAEADARRAAERAERRLHTAQAHRDDAAAALQEAEGALATARERAEAATLEHRRAQQELEGFSRG
jgi:hypothetical protein